MRYLFFCTAIAVLFTISCEKEVSVSPPDPEINKGVIKISSDPSDCSIFFNGKNSGKITPDSLIFLDPAGYEITLKKKYYKDTTLQVILGRDQRQILMVDYFANPSMYGSMRLTTIPDSAIIFLNDSLLSALTPLLLTGLVPGEYEVKFELEGHRLLQLNTTVSSSNLTNVSVTLRDTTVWVDYKTSNSEMPTNYLTCITVDSQNKIWIGSDDAGLISFDGDQFTKYSTSNSSISSNKITCIFVDQADNIWVGTDTGVNVFNGISWQLFNRLNSGLNNNNITSIKSDIIGEVFISTPSGLVSYNGANWTDYSPQINPYASVSDFEIDDDGTKWIGTTLLGIYEIGSTATNHYTDSTHNIPTNLISSVIKSSDGNKWFTHLSVAASRGGVSVYDGTSFQRFFMGSSFIAPKKIFIDTDDINWVSTDEGIFLISASGQISAINTSNSLISSVNIRGITSDANGVFWIATFGGGLNKYKR